MTELFGIVRWGACFGLPFFCFWYASVIWTGSYFDVCRAYAAGVLKHGPIALVDEDMPVVAVAPDDLLLEKLRSNLQEVKARGGELYVFSDPRIKFVNDEVTHSMLMPIAIKEFQGPILYSIPLQLLAYHVAVIKGTDIDQPRNLAKSVTVE